MICWYSLITEETAVWFPVFFPFPQSWYSPGRWFNILTDDSYHDSYPRPAYEWLDFLNSKNLTSLLHLGQPWQRFCHHQQKLRLSFTFTISNHTLYSLQFLLFYVSTCSLTSPRLLVPWTFCNFLASISVLFPSRLKKTWCQFYHSLANFLNSFAALFYSTYMEKNKNSPILN